MNTWYATLNRPRLTPPDWVFFPVWSMIYLMIGISLILFFRNYKGGQGRTVYLIIILNVVSNLIWTSIFFKLQSPGLALLDITLIDITLIMMVWYFWQTNIVSSILLWPYLLWVLFATYLNAGFYILNKT